MTDGNGRSGGSSHGPAGGHSRTGGETFFRPYVQGTRYEDVINNRATRRGWARDGISFINKNEILISEKTGKIKLFNQTNGSIIEIKHNLSFIEEIQEETEYLKLRRG